MRNLAAGGTRTDVAQTRGRLWERFATVKQVENHPESAKSRKSRGIPKTSCAVSAPPGMKPRETEQFIFSPGVSDEIYIKRDKRLKRKIQAGKPNKEDTAISSILLHSNLRGKFERLQHRLEEAGTCRREPLLSGAVNYRKTFR